MQRLNEIEQPRHDGTTVWTDVVGRYYIDPETGRLLAYGVTRDATERRAREDEIRELNATLEARVRERTAQLEAAILELRRAERLKDEFLSTVSHELRTPLTGVLGMADALEMQVSGQLNERQLRYVRQIRESGDRLLATVNSILSYAELLADTAPIQVEPCRLLELGALSLRTVRARTEARQLKLSVQIEPDDLEILSDANGIIQVLQRLIDNAVKFTPEHGSVGLKFTRDHEVVYLTVWDTGIGIEPGDQERIFRPFVQLDGGLGRRYEGVGLGLAYAYQMVSRLGGQIAVESAPGEGSRFTVTLPSAPATGAVARPGFLGTA
ncbi:MAG: HAMP domain-containing histidine kinase [Anaerolineales bacterium]|nr:HAMP domain-containing histidine kinase [Anaerolineales bacterium]